MGISVKKKKQKIQIQKRQTDHVEPIDQNILDSIGNPNVWTPEKEEVWLEELTKLSAAEVYRRFPPLRKPPSVRKRSKSSGWGGTSA